MSATPHEERESIKANLKAWWSNFTKGSRSSGSSRDKSRTFSLVPSSAIASGSGSGQNERVFGEPLRKSLKYASVAISMADEEGKQYIWGYVPVVVAKVGLFLKENATEVEGVFRIAGSQKRMRELQETFDTPPKYGKQLTWERYSVHDAASVLRRYLNQMPEPIVPLQFYNEFRNAMQKEPLEVESATRTYRLLIQAMPPANRYLLLYVLDLLAVFARKSDQNRMPASNLAVIFQPGIFSHPSHLQDANEHRTAVEVLEFLIEHQDHFVLGISPPPPTNVGPSELTQVSLPPTETRPDVADLSESDEELGDLIVHEGGGAQLAKRRGSDVGVGAKKSGKGGSGALGIFRSRSLRRNSKSSATTSDISAIAATAATTGDSSGKSKGEGISFDTERTPAPADGEIHEVGLGERSASPQIVTAQVRRSKTLPHGKQALGKATDTSSVDKDARPSLEEQRSQTEESSLQNPPVVESGSAATSKAAPDVATTSEILAGSIPPVDSVTTTAKNAEGSSLGAAEQSAASPRMTTSAGAAGSEATPSAASADVTRVDEGTHALGADLLTPPSSEPISKPKNSDTKA